MNNADCIKLKQGNSKSDDVISSYSFIVHPWAFWGGNANKLVVYLCLFLHPEFDIKEEVKMLLGLSSAKLNPSNSVMQACRTVFLLSI